MDPKPPTTTTTTTKLAYFDDMRALRSSALLLALLQVDDGRLAAILDATIFHPQGGGQPADTGFIIAAAAADDDDGGGCGAKFVVEDVRLKEGVVFHYGKFEDSEDECQSKLREGQKVSLHIDAQRREINSRLHSAGHLLDICMQNVGLSHLEPGKCYHFPDGPFVEYKGVIPPDQLQNKQHELEREANSLISRGGKVSASILSYEEAVQWCGGSLPSYISKDSTPRIVKFGDHRGCPCGGTHVADIADIKNLKVTQIRMKKGLTKVFYSIST
ncbi:uncharacterized protein LOC109716006 [Ananas comosus]|uniref:Alanyl-tRNA editing protein AlaX-L n=2 Tax=Ananas comosus TaxID=4615 RepID=A0A199VNI9_ANACO|nr:uncharacterized protein LOC109716006 [Ananas comosus]OAY78275.1 Alanyl-tRNA editing protein AlaX-L [Ananas comosus]CAD1842740.1 unnamed protein product [Ananas comosus var. bracteatus]